jgi:hypothetical protein
MLPVSLDFPFLMAPSVFSNGYQLFRDLDASMTSFVPYVTTAPTISAFEILLHTSYLTMLVESCRSWYSNQYIIIPEQQTVIRNQQYI